MGFIDDFRQGRRRAGRSPQPSRREWPLIVGLVLVAAIGIWFTFIREPALGDVGECLAQVDAEVTDRYLSDAGAGLSQERLGIALVSEAKEKNIIRAICRDAQEEEITLSEATDTAWERITGAGYYELNRSWREAEERRRKKVIKELKDSGALDRIFAP